MTTPDVQNSVDELKRFIYTPTSKTKTKTKEQKDVLTQLLEVEIKVKTEQEKIDDQNRFIEDSKESLNMMQQTAFDAVLEGKSIFLTGPGGTGKSYLINTLYTTLPIIKKKKVAVTALTGCAALIIGTFAKTIHSWAGIGLGKESVKDLCSAIKKKGRAKKHWIETDVLIIDEVSMMTAELLHKLNEIAKNIRRDERPFGGIQLILVGDFFQLPPIFTNIKSKDIIFVFESPLWSELVQETVCLTEIVRQSEEEFHTILNEARFGQLSETSIAILRKREGVPWKKLEIKPTLLFSRRADVDFVNESNLKALVGEKHIYKVETKYGPEHTTNGVLKSDVQYAIEYLDKNAPYRTELILGMGAQVMLLVNIADLNLANGSRGVVVGFDIGGEPRVKFLSGHTMTVSRHSWLAEEYNGLYRTQIPLILAYAITIHKSQGATLDSALIDIGPSTFEYGQAYVALSRVKSLESLYIYDFEPNEIKALPKVKAFYKKLMDTIVDKMTND